MVRGKVAAVPVHLIKVADLVGVWVSHNDYKAEG